MLRDGDGNPLNCVALFELCGIFTVLTLGFRSKCSLRCIACAAHAFAMGSPPHCPALRCAAHIVLSCAESDSLSAPLCHAVNYLIRRGRCVVTETVLRCAMLRSAAVFCAVFVIGAPLAAL